MPRKIFGCLTVALFLLSFSCTTHHKIEVAPMEVKPIHITIDVNIRVDRALDNFFDDIDKEAQKIDEKQPVKP